MKKFFRVTLFSVLLLTSTLFFLSCTKKKDVGVSKEALKLAAKDFQPTLINLETVLKSGDVATAKDTLALLLQKLNTIKAAEVPARLAENADKVKSQVDVLSTALAELSTALSNPDLTTIDSTMLDSYTKVRINFARLGGMLRFKIPELVAFHDMVLHDIWHEAYPNDDFAAIRAAVPEFKAKVAAMDNIQWPEALADQIEAIKGKVISLQAAVNALDIACQGDDTEAIKKATEEVHSLYETIVRML